MYPAYVILRHACSEIVCKLKRKMQVDALNDGCDISRVAWVFSGEINLWIRERLYSLVYSDI